MKTMLLQRSVVFRGLIGFVKFMDEHVGWD